MLNEFELKHIDAIRGANLVTGAVFLVQVVTTVLAVLVAVIAEVSVPGSIMDIEDGSESWTGFFGFVVFQLIAAWLVTLIVLSIYNTLARRMGGLRITLNSVEETT